jgi:hypothetical protein
MDKELYAKVLNHYLEKQQEQNLEDYDKLINLFADMDMEEVEAIVELTSHYVTLTKRQLDQFDKQVQNYYVDRVALEGLLRRESSQEPKIPLYFNPKWH